jgi:hypothetical protein
MSDPSQEIQPKPQPPPKAASSTFTSSISATPVSRPYTSQSQSPSSPLQKPIFSRPTLQFANCSPLRLPPPRMELPASGSFLGARPGQGRVAGDEMRRAAAVSCVCFSRRLVVRAGRCVVVGLMIRYMGGGWEEYCYVNSRG